MVVKTCGTSPLLGGNGSACVYAHNPLVSPCPERPPTGSTGYFLLFQGAMIRPSTLCVQGHLIPGPVQQDRGYVAVLQTGVWERGIVQFLTYVFPTCLRHGITHPSRGALLSGSIALLGLLGTSICLSPDNSLKKQGPSSAYLHLQRPRMWSRQIHVSSFCQVQCPPQSP